MSTFRGTRSIEITKYDDIIDSREVIARIEELEDEIATIEDMPEGDQLKNTEEGEALREELRILKTLAEEAEGYADDWKYGAQLIRDSYFEEFAQEFADDIGLILKDAKWPYTCIDWAQAARELQQDYTSVDFDGVTYWIR